MSGRPIQKATADVSTVIRIIDETAGTPETGVEHDTAGIDLWYRREGATATSITEAALAGLASAHDDGGIEHIGDGYYRLDLPDAACGSGVNGVAIGGTVTGMVVIGTYHALVDYDPYDAVRMGMTALPNAVVDNAGGLPISDAGGLDLDAIKAVTDALPDSGALTDIAADTARLTAVRAAVLTDWINGGRLDLLLDAVKAVTDALTAAAATNMAASAGTIVVDTVDTGYVETTTTLKGGGTASLSAVDDHYNGRIIIFTDGTLEDQATDITDYDGTTKVFTVTALTSAAADGVGFVIV